MIKICPICYKEFIPKRKNGKFCSEKCQNKNYEIGYKKTAMEGWKKVRDYSHKYNGIGI